MSVLVAASEVPVEIRAEAARRAIEDGGDPYEMLALAIWPEDVSAVFEKAPTIMEGACVRGHPWNDENTRIRSNGCRVCRVCDRESGRKQRHRLRRVPCSYCGGPAARPDRTRYGPNAVARCRSCWQLHKANGGTS